MTGQEEINAGDILVSITNQGLNYMGDETLIWGISEKSINVNGSTTGWTSRKDFRWWAYQLKKSSIVPEKVIEFGKKVEEITGQNKIHLQRQKDFLGKRKLA